jgi:hypothetical protein
LVSQLRALHVEFKGAYGSPRMCAALRERALISIERRQRSYALEAEKRGEAH